MNTNKTWVHLAVAVAAVSLLSACLSRSADELSTDAKNMLQDNRPTATLETLETLEAQRQAQSEEERATRNAAMPEEPRFSLSVRSVDVVDFFARLTEETPYSLAVHPDVTGNITINLRNVTLQETLNVIQDIYGYYVKRENNIFRIYPAGMRTETIKLDYLSLTRFGMSQTQITAGGVVANQGMGGGGYGNNSQGGMGGNQGGFGGNRGGNNMGGGYGGNQMGGMGGMMQGGSSINTTAETEFWETLEDILTGIVGDGEGRKVVVSPQAGLATVRALPGEIRAVREFINMAENSLQRQVVLEARIVEVTLSDEYQQGVDWSRIASRSRGITDFSFTSGQVDSGSLGGVLGISFGNQTFGGMVEMLSTQGNVQVLSSPRVTAVNNQKAVIKIGEDEYFVTDVSTTTVTGTATTSTPNIQLTPFFSGIALDVTPQIGDSGMITLHVHPSVTETREQEKVIALNQDKFVLPLARSNIRESDTVIRANDGEVVIIGGLMQTTYDEIETQVPFLGSIPLVGNLFKNKHQRQQKKELVIMLRPTIVGVNTWSEELEQSRRLLDQWYGTTEDEAAQHEQ